MAEQILLKAEEPPTKKDAKPVSSTERMKSFRVDRSAKNDTDEEIRVGSLEVPYKCKTCDRSYSNSPDLELHVLTEHEGAGVDSYLCNVCSKSYSDIVCLRRHVTDHATVKDPAAEEKADGNDDVMIPVKKRRRRHVKDHATVRDPAAEEKADGNDDVTIPVKKRRGRPGNGPYECKVCHVLYPSRDSLRAHNKTHKKAAGDRPVRPRKKYPKKALENMICNVCAATLKGSWNLQLHMRTHTGEKPFVCEFCAAAFTRREYLLSHLQRHTGEYKYRCEQCSATFADHSAHRYHMKAHSGDKKFLCDYCPYSFITHAQLRRHLVIHTKEGKFVCHVCTASFKRQFALKKHIRSHTDHESFQCKGCSELFDD